MSEYEDLIDKYEELEQRYATLASLHEVATERTVELSARVAKAWDEGALWAAVECGAIPDEREPWLAPGDNPYREGSDRG